VTGPSKLAALADAISASSSRIKAFAKAAAVISDDHDARIAKLEANLPVVPPVPVRALLFADEFDAPLDLGTWDVKARVANLSKTWFSPDNVSVDKSCLVIDGRLAAPGQWHGGEIQLLAAYAYTGARYSEVRAQLPAGAGTWSAPLWEVDAPWGSQGIENDVCEQLGIEPTKYHVTVHNGKVEKFDDARRREGSLVQSDPTRPRSRALLPLEEKRVGRNPGHPARLRGHPSPSWRSTSPTSSSPTSRHPIGTERGSASAGSTTGATGTAHPQEGSQRLGRLLRVGRPRARPPRQPGARALDPEGPRHPDRDVPPVDRRRRSSAPRCTRPTG
jgi:hypothetical protein